MTPFPEAEDMTVKRLYVALKRNDMELLKMGAHKLYEKYHTGYKFQLLDDLAQITEYVKNKEIPNDVRDLLISTIVDILNNKNPFENQYSDAPAQNGAENAPLQAETDNAPAQTETAENTSSEKDEANTPIQGVFENTSAQNEVIEEYNQTSANDALNENMQIQNDNMQSEQPAELAEQAEAPIEEGSQMSFELQNPQAEFAKQTEQINQTGTSETIEFEGSIGQTEAQGAFNQTEPASSNPLDAADNTQSYQTSQNQSQDQVQNHQQARVSARGLTEQAFTTPFRKPQITSTFKENFVTDFSKQQTSSTGGFKGNVAVFYDDKAQFIDYAKNKLYKTELNLLSLDREVCPLNSAAVAKGIADVRVDEFSEILKMLKTIEGETYFITSSKSENILKTVFENNIDFEIPLIKNNFTNHSKTKIIPLFGLSNMFICPKCNKREYLCEGDSKILTVMCKNCNSPMYPEIYEADGYSTNANPYFWMAGLKYMANADTWILINPPLKSSRELISDFLRIAYEVSSPKKVYILSKEATRREYYKQMFNEINQNCTVKSDLASEDILCENFINTEMKQMAQV